MAPDSLSEPVAVASHVAEALTRIGVSYVIGGSFASSVHGEPRSTNDIDMVADLRQSDVNAFVDSLAGEASERQWRDVAGIVEAQSSRLDRAYLREWAARLGVSDLTERAFEDFES